MRLFYVFLYLPWSRQGLLMPKTGSLVMIDEICDIVAIWTVCIYVIVRIIQSRGRFQASVKANTRSSVMCGDRRTVYEEHGSGSCVRAGDGSIDGYTGQQIPAHTGIFSLHYYLTGTDSRGERVRLEISGDDYTRLSGSSSVTVEYYRHTGRIVRYL